MKKKFLIYTALLGTLVMTGCKDEFSDINTDPSVVQPEIRYLFTKALIQMDPGEYKMWFYNNSRMYLPWTQAIAATKGNTDQLNQMDGGFFPQENQIRTVKTQVEAIRFKLTTLSETEAASYAYIDAICNPMLVFIGLLGTDSYGSMAYTESGKAYFYDDPKYLTPKYETQKELLELWLQELDQTIKVLSNPVKIGDKEIPQVPLGTQDFVYNGDAKRWLKFTNSLKLKIAVRMLNVDKARALAIANEVTSSSAGVLNSLSDDFTWNPGSQYYHFGDNINFGAGTNNLINFLVANKDPRVRFLFQKNDFNSKIVSAFIANGKKLPFYIDQYVNYTTDAAGNKKFDGWKAPGEPWVRYQGVPLDFQAKFEPAMIDAYYADDNFKLEIDSKEKTYKPVSLYQQEMVRGEAVYDYPALPNENPVKDDTPQPFYAVYLSTAEVNLYLAEFKLLGANLPGSASEYYNRAVEMSVRMMDRVAALNKIPYYVESSQGYTETETSIALKEGELAPLLAQPAYQLTGSVAEQLEKVYIQQYIHFLYSPNDLFVTVRRSGVPMKGSKVLARIEFDKGNPNYVIPRRLMINAINPSDQMSKIKEAAYKEEGFTTGTNNPTILSNERIWYDKLAPAFGTGPKL